MPVPQPSAVVFDVFGTVVDWRTCVVDEAKRCAGAIAASVDWGAFADQWRTEGYLAPISEIVAGARPYTDVEVLLRQSLDELLARHGVDLGPRELDALSSVWRRLDPWPDAIEGLEKLRAFCLIAPLSNGSFALLTSMAKRAGLPWDCVISTELFGTYKPDPAAYLGAARLLGLPPNEVMLVAAHPGDLRAAQAVGLRTAYVPRPLEWGPNTGPVRAGASFDVVADDLVSLADQLGRPEEEAAE